MIEYKHLETTTDNLNDVKLITNDGNDIERLQKAFHEFDVAELESYKNFTSAEIDPESGDIHFVIPGDEVATFAEIVWEIDMGELEILIDKWNEEARIKIEAEVNE